MAHNITTPAIQRAQRLLQQRVAPFVLTTGVDFTVDSTQEWFESPSCATATSSTLTPFIIGSKWGRPWHTRWFRLSTDVPSSLADIEVAAHINLGFIGRGDGFEVEGLAWRDGKILHAIQPDRRLLHLGQLTAGEHLEIWIEAAATPIIAGHEFGYGPTAFGDPSTAPQQPIYTLRTAQLVAFHSDINELSVALHAVIDLAMDLAEHSAQRSRMYAALDACGQALDVRNVQATAPQALSALNTVLSVKNGPSAHRITATGHAHLDTAWLWPIRETRRKAVRTFANVVDLMRRNPDMVYCHSQAQHYSWVAQDAPEIFSEVQRLVAQGRWEHVGGMWVETDLNLPSGESLLRQLVQGQRAFRNWFGTTSKVAFLPDDFGYPGSLPQILAHGGCTQFFTQKLSWNETNKFPHHTFWWEGIDGTKVFSHFSPVDTYNAIMTPSQLRFADHNFRDHVGSSHSLVLYGHGDGGGGPTQTMIDRARLAADLEGVPRIAFGTVHQFFETAEEEYGATAPHWVGEMYFEKHRGTYSTQVGTKQGNRNSERLLHEVEVWSAAAGVRPTGIDTLWQRVLTQQFHDIIPGSSIAWVHDDAEAEHAAVAVECESILGSLMSVADDYWVLNASPIPQRRVIDVNGLPRWAEVPAFSSVPLSPHHPHDLIPVSIVTAKQSLTMSNGLLSASIDADGFISSINNGARDIIPPGMSGRFVLLADTPAEYDAWDIDMADANGVPTPLVFSSAPRVIEENSLRSVIECVFATKDSTFAVQYTLCAGADVLDVTVDADWHENEQRLQWVLPTDLMARDTKCGTQFGHVSRPRHGNTSWDIAKFEVCAHRYVACSEPNFGVAILADGPHGYDVRGNALRLTVLRSPKFPDPQADQGAQKLSWSVRLTNGDPIVDGIEETAAAIEHPLRVSHHTLKSTSCEVLAEIPGALISALKLADDNTGDLIVRMWESRGARTTGSLHVARSRTMTSCNALEEPTSPNISATDNSFQITLRPFEIATYRISR